MLKYSLHLFRLMCFENYFVTRRFATLHEDARRQNEREMQAILVFVELRSSPFSCVAFSRLQFTHELFLWSALDVSPIVFKVFFAWLFNAVLLFFV